MISSYQHIKERNQDGSPSVLLPVAESDSLRSTPASFCARTPVSASVTSYDHPPHPPSRQGFHSPPQSASKALSSSRVRPSKSRPVWLELGPIFALAFLYNGSEHMYIDHGRSTESTSTSDTRDVAGWAGVARYLVTTSVTSGRI